MSDSASSDPGFNSQPRKVIFHYNQGKVVNLHLLTLNKPFIPMGSLKVVPALAEGLVLSAFVGLARQFMKGANNGSCLLFL